MEWLRRTYPAAYSKAVRHLKKKRKPSRAQVTPDPKEPTAVAGQTSEEDDLQWFWRNSRVKEQKQNVAEKERELDERHRESVALPGRPMAREGFKPPRKKWDDKKRS